MLLQDNSRLAGSKFHLLAPGSLSVWYYTGPRQRTILVITCTLLSVLGSVKVLRTLHSSENFECSNGSRIHTLLSNICVLKLMCIPLHFLQNNVIALTGLNSNAGHPYLVTFTTGSRKGKSISSCI